MAICVTIITERLEKRSAITPAIGENSRIGRNCRPGRQTEGAGAPREGEDQPVLGDALHPGPGV